MGVGPLADGGGSRVIRRGLDKSLQGLKGKSWRKNTWVGLQPRLEGGIYFVSFVDKTKGKLFFQRCNFFFSKRILGMVNLFSSCEYFFVIALHYCRQK